MNSWLKPSRSGQREGKSPGMDLLGWNHWLCFPLCQPGTLLSFAFLGLVCCHTLQTPIKQISLSISGHCQAFVLWAANPYLSSQLHRPSSPCQTSFSMWMWHLPPPPSWFVYSWSRSLFPHFISLQRSNPRPIEMFPSASMGLESGPTSLSLSGILCCLWVRISSLFARPLLPSPFHSAIWNMLWDLLSPAWPTMLAEISDGQQDRGHGRRCRNCCAQT